MPLNWIGSALGNQPRMLTDFQNSVTWVSQPRTLAPGEDQMQNHQVYKNISIAKITSGFGICVRVNGWAGDQVKWPDSFKAGQYITAGDIMCETKRIELLGNLSPEPSDRDKPITCDHVKQTSHPSWHVD
jgi:hypothetical protein